MAVVEPDRFADALRVAELVVQRDTGRNIAAIARFAAGGLGRAAASLAGAAGSVAIVTGFYISDAVPPAAETDGPPGAGLLAERLRAAGIPAVLVTDRRCAPVVRAVGEAAGVETLVAGDDAAAVDDLAARLRARGVDHVVFVERAGPAADGEVHTMRGEPITGCTAPLHRLALAGGWRTIGIGDGGNEVGMGAVPHAIVAEAVEHGDRIHCAVACDELVVAGVSNWGAAALGGAVGALRTPGLPLEAAALAGRHAELLDAALAGGAVDGTTSRPQRSVDGVGAGEHGALLTELAGALERARRAISWR
ncbi:MAG TPA: glutamate cyclase domain-containing protein [Baekduia sp.]|nr:glutamate cyclase domain-containing protein [Baekduia sp.]